MSIPFDESKVNRDHGRFAPKGYADTGQLDLGPEQAVPTASDLAVGATFVKATSLFDGPETLELVTVEHIGGDTFALDDGQTWRSSTMAPLGESDDDAYNQRLHFCDPDLMDRYRRQARLGVEHDEVGIALSRPRFDGEELTAAVGNLAAVVFEW